MIFNEKEIIELAHKTADLEGRVKYAVLSPRSPISFKEMWFKLIGNLLFIYKLNEFGGIQSNKPNNVLVLENCRCQREAYLSESLALVIIYTEDPEKKHVLCFHKEEMLEQWYVAIEQASYNYQRYMLEHLRNEIFRFSGKNPLQGVLYNQGHYVAVKNDDSCSTSSSCNSQPISPRRERSQRLKWSLLYHLPARKSEQNLPDL